MMTEYLKLGLDILILAGLGGFIFYALQLSKALNAFRAHRNEFDGIMRNLTRHIDDAQVAVNQLKETSQESGDELHKLVRDAQFLADELQQINEVSESLASRLEQAAERGRKGLKIPDTDLGDNVSPISRGRSHDDEFTIQDPDFPEDDNDVFDEDPDIDGLSSQAEKELLRALKKNKK